LQRLGAVGDGVTLKTPGLELVAAVMPLGLALSCGFSIGTLAVVLAARRWVAISSSDAGRNIFHSLQRIGTATLFGGLLATWLASHLLETYLHAHGVHSALGGCLWGYALGLAIGVRWWFRRGLR
jgi:hypothetical protein